MFYEYDCVMALYKCKQKLGQVWALMNRHTENENLKIFFLKSPSSFFECSVIKTVVKIIHHLI